MEKIFASLLEMSLSGSIVILLVLALRLVLKKAPARLVCFLWLLVGIRLFLPLHIEANFSLQPDMKELLTPVVTEYVPQYIASVAPERLEPVELPVDDDTAFVEYELQRPVHWTTVAAYVWALGAGAMLVYTVVSYIKLKRQVRTAVRAANGAWECDRLDGAFLLGYLKPRIFLPAGLSGEDREYVMSHERTHIAWGDNWTKLIGFLCLSIHWFNPLVWLAYWCLCKDLETACDEQVVNGYDVQQRKAYSKALLFCSTGRRPASACPIAFGEVNVKERIIKVLNYRKPSFWICIVCILALISASLFFLTDPAPSYDTVFEKYASMLGTDKDEFLKELGVQEDGVRHIVNSGDIFLDPIEYGGGEWYMVNTYHELTGNRVASLEFTSTFDSFDQMAQMYLHLFGSFSENYKIKTTFGGAFADLQQMKEAYDGRPLHKQDTWSVSAIWDAGNEDDRYKEVNRFMEDLLEMDEELGLSLSQHGPGVIPVSSLNVTLICRAGKETYQVKVEFSIKTDYVSEPSPKIDAAFFKYISSLGLENDAYLETVGAKKEDVRLDTRGYVWLEPLETMGTKWYISNFYSTERQQVTHVEFHTDKTTSFDDNAAHYLHMLAILKQVYGEPAIPGASTLEELRESYDRWPNKAGGAWPESTVWRIEDIGFIHPQLQERLEQLAKTEPVTEAMKAIYGNDVKLKPSFMITLVCTKGTDGNCRTSVTISAGLGTDK